MPRRRAPDNQLNLFGDPPPPPAKPARAPAVEPALLDPGDEKRAAQLPASFRMGTSSWSFPGWSGIVYDRQASKGTLAKKGLEAYAQHPLLRAVGIDRTYYGPISAGAFADYAAQVPDDFRFLVKAASHCTDPFVRGERGAAQDVNPLYLDAGFARDEIVAPFVEGLGARGGVLLFQMPPQGARAVDRPREFADRLAAFLEALPKGVPYAVELRDRALVTPDYFAALAAGDARHGYCVHPRMPTLAEQRAIDPRPQGGPLTLRWMLQAGLHYEQARDRYDPFDRLVDEDLETREAVARLCLEHAATGEPVILVANNKAEGSAPLTLFEVAARIAELMK